MRILILAILLIGFQSESKAQLYDNGNLYINGNFIIVPISVVVSGNLTFLSQNLQFNGSVLTFLGD